MPVSSDDTEKEMPEDPLIPLNARPRPARPVAVALRDGSREGRLPEISAAGRGKIAEQILQLAFESGVHVREDKALAEMLAAIEIDSPVPSEAFMAIAEVLSYVYRANGEPDPYNAVLGAPSTKEEGHG